MICSECGNHIPDDAAVCPSCGSVAVRGNEDTVPETGDDGRGSSYISAFDVPAADENTPGGRSEKISGKAVTAVIAAVAVIILSCYYILPQSRFKRIMKRAESRLADSEIVLAAEDYRKALRIMPDSEEAQAALYDIWSTLLDKVMSLIDGRRFEEALVSARLLPSIDPDRATMNHSALTVVYKQWARDLAQADDMDAVDRLLSDAAADLTQEEIGDVSREASQARDLQKALEQLNDSAGEIIALSEEGRDAEVFGRIAGFTELVDLYMDLGGNAPFEFAPEGSAKTLGFFFAGYDVSVVIGTFDPFGMPDGHAMCYYSELMGTEDEYRYWYSCDWADGRPCGYCEYREAAASGEDGTSGIIMKGTLTDGDWDGEVEETYTDGETYILRFAKGRVEVLEIEGADMNIVGYNKSGDKKRYYTDLAVDREIGVPYMYYS